MGANSVTGTGRGSVEKFGGGKGPGNLRGNCVPMQTPHVVAAGTASSVTTSGLQINLATALPLASTNYVVLVTPKVVQASDTIVVKHDTDDQMDYFTITVSTTTSDVDWVVIRAGQGLETSRNWVPEAGNSVSAE